MAKKRKRSEKKSPEEQAERVSFRLDDLSAEKVAKAAKAEGISPHVYSRIATRAFVNHSFLDLAGRMARIEDQLIRVRKELSERRAESRASLDD